MPTETQVPLGFIEASERLRDNKITWNEYLHHIFLHCLPAWHEEHANFRTMRWLSENDPFASTVYYYHASIHDLRDTTKLEQNIHVAERGNLPELRTKLDELPEDARTRVISSVALLALQGRKLALLRLCLEEYPERYLYYEFEDAANAVQEAKEPVLHQIIQKSYWRAWHKWRKPGERDIRSE